MRFTIARISDMFEANGIVQNVHKQYSWQIAFINKFWKKSW